MDGGEFNAAAYGVLVNYLVQSNGTCSASNENCAT